VRYYLYAESMMDEDCIPVAEHMKVYEKDNVCQAAQACMELHAVLRVRLGPFTVNPQLISLLLNSSSCIGLLK